MEITKGILEDISRPASSERSRPGSRISSASLYDGVKVSQDRPMSLEVLSSDFTETQDQLNLQEDNFRDATENLPSDQDEENEDAEVQKAIKKMKRLDRILASTVSNEKEVKKQGRELHHKLCQELEAIKQSRTTECSDEAQNTRLFLALTPSSLKDCNEDVDFVPVFGTQVPDKESDHNFKLKNEEVRVLSKSSGSTEEAQGLRRDKQSNSSPTAVGKSKHEQDFVKRNIELAGAGSLVLMTKEEKERIEELLKDLEEEEDDDDDDAAAEPLAKHEIDLVLCPSPRTLGEGYTPPPDELEHLLQIDARLQLLLPFENFLSVRSPYIDHSWTQGRPPCSDGDRPPGEKVLRNMKEARGQEGRLRRIQQQLQLLEQSQQTTSLPEEQLRNLLVECETALSRSSGSSSRSSSPMQACALPGHAMSLLASTPRLCSSALSELLQEPWPTRTTPLQTAEGIQD